MGEKTVKFREQMVREEPSQENMAVGICAETVLTVLWFIQAHWVITQLITLAEKQKHKPFESRHILVALSSLIQYLALNYGQLPVLHQKYVHFVSFLC